MRVREQPRDPHAGAIPSDCAELCRPSARLEPVMVLGGENHPALIMLRGCQPGGKYLSLGTGSVASEASLFGSGGQLLA